MLSAKLDKIAFSQTMNISAKTIEMQNDGITVYNLCVGEPDLPTPEHIKLAGKKAIEENKTKYTVNSGIKELKEAIRDKYLKEYNAEYNLDEIIISNGAKQSVYNVLQAVVSEGEEVILPLPYYVSYPDMIHLAGGVTKYVTTKIENEFKLTAEELRNNITENTKVVILCNPNNPSGSVYTKDELKSLVEVAYEYNLLILSDEIYEKLIYDSFEFTSIATLWKKYRNNLVLVNGVSKTYSMTGWRIGYTLAIKEIISGMNRVQSHSTAHPCSISQYAAVAAINGDQACVENQRKIFEERKVLVSNALKEIDLFSFIEPKGAFYFFVNIQKLIDQSSILNNSNDFCNKLLDEAHVAAVPGNVFGMEGYIRITYAKSCEELSEAMKLLKKSVNEFI